MTMGSDMTVEVHCNRKPSMMPQRLSLTALLVDDYDRAIAYYVGKLGFDLREDTLLSQDKRWVVVAPPGSDSALLLARAANDRQKCAIGDQSGAGLPVSGNGQFCSRSCALCRARRSFHRNAASGSLWNRRGLRGPLRQSLGSDQPIFMIAHCRASIYSMYFAK
jgi:hypothetical protein